MIRCEGRVQRVGDRTIIRLPDDASARLPSRGQVAVNAVMNGRRLSTVLEPDGRRGHWIAIDSALRQALALDAGATVTLEIESTTDWPEPDMPTDFKIALADTPDLAQTWQSITPIARWEWVRWVNATKNPQTRERRVGVSISKLRSGKRRPCCFDLSSCTDPDLSKSGKLIDID